jgi:cation diffusion facilitator family transporter
MAQVGREQAAAEVRRAGWVGLIGNLGLATLKMTAGILGHSAAVVADAVHSLSDLVTDFAVIAGVHFWSKPADRRHPHGHQRIETLVSVVIGVILALVAVGMAVEAVSGGHSRVWPAPTGIAFVAALLSMFVKEGLYHWTVRVGRRVDSPALVANAWHHRSDALSSVPAAIAVGVAVLNPELGFVDRIGAVVVCMFILFAAWQIVAPALSQLIDTAAPEEDRLRLEELAKGVDGVRDAHAIRTRYVGPKLAVDLHVVVDPELSVEQGHGIAEAVRHTLLEEGPKVEDVLVKVEPDDGQRTDEFPAISPSNP